jgi:hypothetical protein
MARNTETTNNVNEATGNITPESRLDGLVIAAKCKTRFNENSVVQAEQEILFSLDGLTVGDLFDYARKSLVVSWQRSQRSFETEQEFLEFIEKNPTYKVLATDAGKKIEKKPSKAKMAATAATMAADDLALLIEQMQQMHAQKLAEEAAQNEESN